MDASLNFKIPPEADAFPLTVEQVMHRISQHDPEFATLYKSVVEPQLRSRYNTGSWPEGRKAFLLLRTYEAICTSGARDELGRESAGDFEVKQSEVTPQLLLLRKPDYLPTREHIGGVFGFAHQALIEQQTKWNGPLGMPSQTKHRNDLLWRFCASKAYPQYEILSVEMVSALSDYLVERAGKHVLKNV